MIYDIVVIGAGAGGLNIAVFMNKVGFKVLLVDKSDSHIGGDCLNFGCVPSKALIHVSRVIYDAKQAKKFGLKSDGTVSMKKISDYIRSKQDVIREHENAAYFRKQGIDVVLGEAKFVGKNEIQVAGRRYIGKKLVLATGSRPRKLDIPGIENVDYHTNETIFSLQKLPKSLLVIGGGPIGIEIGQAFRRLGSDVGIVQRGEHFLPKETPEMADVLFNQLQKEGIKFFFNANPVEFSSPKELIVETKAEKRFKVKFDAVLIAIGRQLNIDTLDIEKAGIKTDESGHKLIVDEYLRTTNKDIYVCGDTVGGFQFTHAAELHAGVLLRNFFSPFKKKVNNDHLSWVTYTSPEIATFGLSEKELQKRGMKYEKLSLDFTHDDRAIVDEFTEGKLIVFISKKGKLLGGSMAAPNAGELFQELVLSNTAGLTIKDIFTKIYPYPTATRVNKKIISNHFATKLTPFTKKLLKFLY